MLTRTRYQCGVRGVKIKHKIAGSKRLVVVAMSGGVDSSVAAALLKKQGYEVIGMTMCFNLPDVKSKKPRCCSVQDIEDAQRVCHKLGIRHYKINLSKTLKEKVIKDFCAQYLKGCTPNPCVICNTLVKFGALLSKARSVGADYLATGHYANIFYNKRIKMFQLRTGKDKSKDQTYFLYRLTQAQLSCSLMPLGNLTKPEVRALAKKFKLSVAEKRGSQEICFFPQDDYREFLKANVNKRYIKHGELVNKNGKILGRHEGIAFYTIGQRKGLGIAVGRPLYVTKINSETNTVVVGDKKGLLSKGLIVKNTHFIAESINKKTSVKVKIRYNHPGADAAVIPIDEKTAKVVFKKPQMSVTPGQSAVFYKRGIILGGGIIVDGLSNRLHIR